MKDKRILNKSKREFVSRELIVFVLILLLPHQRLPKPALACNRLSLLLLKSQWGQRTNSKTNKFLLFGLTSVMIGSRINSHSRLHLVS